MSESGNKNGSSSKQSTDNTKSKNGGGDAKPASGTGKTMFVDGKHCTIDEKSTKNETGVAIIDRKTGKFHYYT